MDSIGKPKVLKTDILIIGGGTAGCMAAVRARELNPEQEVTILEKAHINRSGCLAAGINAINAYINPGETPESFVRYVRRDAMGLIREDLVLSMAQRLNSVVKKVESWGLPIKKDQEGKYKSRGRWNIKINGESIKPILAEKVRHSGAKVYNRVACTNLIMSGNRVVGATGFGVRDGQFYVVQAGATIIATGGAAGLYSPNNGGSAHHKIWYSPFNTGAGYALGIRSGAEMTSYEMRFIALRIKDIVAPTGTLALGFDAPQVNAYGERFMAEKFADMGAESAPTPIRVYGPTQELKNGRGPVFMDTTHLSAEEVKELKNTYLDMYPDLILYWAANNFHPEQEPIEIEGTEPYLVGGHAQAGYWVNEDRSTTVPGLFAAGDVAGGAPYKFVSGCWVEGEMAAESALKYVGNSEMTETVDINSGRKKEKERIFAPLSRSEGINPAQMESRLQKLMDEYAGGVSRYYEMNGRQLKLARKRLKHLKEQIQYLKADNLHQLLACHEVIDRIDVARVLVEHLLYRRETRWPAYQTRTDYPERDDQNWLKFVNSVCENGEIKMVERPYERIIDSQVS
ncbi:MAG: adenylyl-sulfate reductase subunit alpha [Halanaerobiaceae bacterium]